MRFLLSSRRPLGLALAALLVVAGALPFRPEAARAQSGLPQVVMIVTYKVEPEHHDAFRAWIAAFREAVEGLIAEGRLSRTDLCAYRSWRVLGPDPAGLNEDFLFVFEPVIPIANYLLQHYLTQALGQDEARERMRRFNAMASDPQIVYASPLDRDVDAIDLGEVCEF